MSLTKSKFEIVVTFSSFITSYKIDKYSSVAVVPSPTLLEISVSEKFFNPTECNKLLTGLTISSHVFFTLYTI